MTLRGMLELTAATLGSSTALSVVTTYLPLLLAAYTSSATLIGLAIGGEGIFGLAIPLLGGYMSDRIWTRWGRREPFMIFSAPFIAAALILAPFQEGFIPLAVITFLFFAAYHLYTSPYQSLLPDVAPLDQQGRIQGAQNFMRGGGMFFGMLVGGILFDLWQPLPFLGAAGLIMVVTFITVSTIKEPTPDPEEAPVSLGFSAGLRDIASSLVGRVRIRRFLVANFLWEATISGIRPFIMLYFLYALGADTRTGALLLGVVGVVHVAAAILTGYLGDRYGRTRIMWIGMAVYFVGCVIGFFLRDLRLGFFLLPIFGLGGSTVLTLPYAIFVNMVPRGRYGQFTGYFSMARAMAVIVSPVIAGIAIDASAPFLTETRGYNMIWGVAAVAVALSAFFFWRANPEEGARPVRVWRPQRNGELGR